MANWGSEAVYNDKLTAANVGVSARVAFIRRTYAHLGGAILAFVGIEAALFTTGIAARIFDFVGHNQYGFLMVFAAFMIVGWIAQRMAYSGASPSAQLAGLGLYTAAEAVIFAPILYFAANYAQSPNVIPAAAITTLCVVAGLTGIVFVTGKDFSFLRTGLSIASFLALGLIICSFFMPFGLGLWFAVGMAALMGGFVLYYTSNILHHYPTDQHVAAALALFSAIATMFWYILQIFMSRD